MIDTRLIYQVIAMTQGMLRAVGVVRFGRPFFYIYLTFFLFFQIAYLGVKIIQRLNKQSKTTKEFQTVYTGGWRSYILHFLYSLQVYSCLFSRRAARISRFL